MYHIPHLCGREFSVQGSQRRELLLTQANYMEQQNDVMEKAIDETMRIGVFAKSGVISTCKPPWRLCR